MLKPIVSPWINEFDGLIAQASASLLICSPFIGQGPCERVRLSLSRAGRTHLPILLLTDLSRDNMLSGSTDVGALADLCEVLPAMKVRFLPNLHAKVYIADEREAVVTSGNLTDAGLRRNFEYGLHITQRELVKQIVNDITQYALLGSAIDISQLREFNSVIMELRELRTRVDKRRTLLRKEFDRKLQAANQEVLRVRAKSYTAHAAFADTIVYLLKQGPKDTKALYTAVQNIHPDLCDDTIKLVIGGETWNQVKWHHRVRHAQLFLKRQGRIRRQNGKWYLIR